MNKENLEISWEEFEACNKDKRTEFEHMCRYLFNQRFFNGKEILHSNPNNPGVEVIPVKEPVNNRRISFQAKYFDNMDYSQILHSCKMAVSHYSGELDVIYLYCNKDVTITSKSYSSIVDYLKEYSIEIIPITNRSILEEVMQNEVIAQNYFNQVSLSHKLLTEKLNVSLKSLGPRYNKDFNVSTSTESYFNVFLCNLSAIDKINNRKNQCIENLKSNDWRQSDYNKYAKIIWKKIKDIPDITTHNIEACLDWKTLIADRCKDEFKEIESLISTKRASLEVETIQKKSHNILVDINALETLLELPSEISPSKYEEDLIKNKVLVVSGEAGAGKSQLFSYAAKSLIEDGKHVILLLGGSYISEQQISLQTSDILNIGLSFDEVLYQLEGAAIKNNCFSYIFIDAINESVHRNIWKTGLTTVLQQISNFLHIKLAISVRDGYENLVFDDSINSQLEDSEILRLRHIGFSEKSVDATKAFLDFYGIPFLPSYYLESDMRNPLFLKLFCQTYSGENYDFFSLFEKLIETAEQEALANCGIKDSLQIVEKLLYDIANVFIQTNSRTISYTDLLSLQFWNMYGLTDKKMPFITSLCKSGLLISYIYDENEYFQLGYNLLDDFICAKTITKQYPLEKEIQKYLCDSVLEIKEGNINNHSNIDTSVIVLSLWFERHNKDLFNEIIQNIKNEIDLEDFSKRYLMSFIWRKATTVNKEAFLNFIRSQPVTTEDVFSVLIENASKEWHPLNALFLHDILINKDLPERDAIWTTFINAMSSDEKRLFQLVLHFEGGNTLDGLSKKNTELLLILFVWLFTSSNRILRDKASKATIELLKVNFNLCLPLLKHFEGVNDPYVIQRLYGVVFGACTKCQNLEYESYKDLVKYVYENIFMQEKVYPDILLRDYAKLIIEKFIFDYPKKSSFVDMKLVTPPYKSDPIPMVEKKEYYDKDAPNQGYNKIVFSMTMNIPETPGMYGDFGRYIFQAALNCFQDIDLTNTFHYAMQFIKDTLGYTEEVLGQYDSRPKYNYISRHQTIKTERIGKKYQWIAMHNILARISDHHMLKEWDEEPHIYEGAWDPFVRDFDPTLNKSIMNVSNVPKFKKSNFDFQFLPIEPNPSGKTIQDWTNKTIPLFSSAQTYLCIKDDHDIEWCALHYNKELRNKEYNFNNIASGMENGSQSMWLIAEAFFVKKSDFQIIKEYCSSSNANVEQLPQPSEVYQLFNREYSWSQGYHSIFKDSWIEHEIESNEYRTETVICEFPDYEHIIYSDDGDVTVPMIKREFHKKVPIESKFIKVAPACSYFLWEEGYDASQEETTNFYMPCYDLINLMNLSQKDLDGFFYAPDGKLVCFDYRLVGDQNCFLIRMDVLKEFLEKEKLQICWKCIGEKQYFLSGHEQTWSRWNGLIYEDDGRLKGEIKKAEGR